MGNPQNADQEIAAKEQELEKLKADKANASIQQYPKMIPFPGDPEKRMIVNSKEEEARHQGQIVQAFDLTPEEQDAKRVARAEADKEAAGAKSRLAGPESAPKASEGNKAKPADKPVKAKGRK